MHTYIRFKNLCMYVSVVEISCVFSYFLPFIFLQVCFELQLIISTLKYTFTFCYRKGLLDLGTSIIERIETDSALPRTYLVQDKFDVKINFQGNFGKQGGS